jgi:multidrug resistance efflux pump
MVKYISAACLLTVIGIIVSIIDARSSEVIGSSPGAAIRREAPKTIYATGVVEGATQDIHLRAEQVGLVREVLVGVGQWVEAGDVLVRLDGDRQQQEVALATARLELANADLERLRNGARPEEREEARALVRAAEARLEQAVRNLERIDQLRADRAVTQQDADDQQALVDTSRAELEAAQARLKQVESPARADEVRAAEAQVAGAEAELNLARIVLSKTEVRAPSRGCVLDIDAEAGELTGPNTARPLVVLSDTSVVRIRAFVEELDAPRVCMGMTARITADGLLDKAFTGQVVSISPQMSSKSMHADRPNELYDTKVREVVLELSDVQEPIVGLRVDVEFADLSAETQRL